MWQVNEAAMAALEEKLTLTNSNLDGALCSIKTTRFEQAATKITPSVTIKVFLSPVFW